MQIQIDKTSFLLADLTLIITGHIVPSSALTILVTSSLFFPRIFLFKSSFHLRGKVIIVLQIATRVRD